MARTKKPALYTIGHSTRTFAEFLELLRAYKIERLIDIRTIPKSRHNPQFGESRLRRSLQNTGISYEHLEALGGLRHAKKDSKNTGWRNTSFRGYADYMATNEFAGGLNVLIERAQTQRTAIMCAEAVPWRCHRSLVADAMTKKGWAVFNIMSKTNAPQHRLTPFLKVRKGVLTYPS